MRTDQSLGNAVAMAETVENMTYPDLLWTDRGQSVLNPRYIRKVQISDEDKPGSATGQRHYKVTAYGEGQSCVLDPGWMDDKGKALALLVRAGKAITGC